MVNWDHKKQQSKGKGIFGRVLAFAPAHEEQGRRTLDSHWQIWVEDLSSQISKDLWNNDSNIRKKTREAFFEYVDEVMTTTYSKPLSFIHNCHESTQGNVLSNDVSAGVPVGDLDCYTDEQTTAVTVANGTCSVTNLEMQVVNLTYDFIIEEPRAKQNLTHVVNPVTHPKSDGQTCI